MPLRVAVVGCGIGGPAAALFLARRGHAVEVFEKARQPGPAGAGILIQPTGLHVLARLGLFQDALDMGTRVNRLWGVDPRGRTVLDMVYDDCRPGLFGLGIHRGLLAQRLARAVREAGIPLECGTAVEKTWSEDGRRFLSDAAGHRRGPYDLVVAADGVRSALRPPSARVSPYRWGALWWLARDEERRFTRTLFQVYAGTRRMTGFLPTGTSPDGVPLVSLFWSLRMDRVEDCRRAGLEAWKREVSALAPQAESLLRQLRSFDEVIVAPYFDVRVDRPQGEGLVLIGDAAHATSPQLGQGANLALCDAMALADELEAAQDLEAGLAAYARRRRPHNRYYQWASRALTPFFQSDRELLAPLRDTFFPLFGRAPFFKGQMLATLAGTKTGWISALPLPPEVGGTSDLYPRLLGPRWDALPTPIRRHLTGPGEGWEGLFLIRWGGNFLARALALLAGLPRPGENVPTRFAVRPGPDGERRVRLFGPVVLTSVESERSPGVMADRLGVLEFHFELRVEKGDLVFHQQRTCLRLGRLGAPCPRFLAPRVAARVGSGPAGRVAVKAEVSSSMLGLLFSYDGVMWETA